MEELAPTSVGERITGDTSWLLLAPEAEPVENSPVFLVMVESRGVGGERWVMFLPPPTTLFFLKYPHLPNSVHSCLDVQMDGLSLRGKVGTQDSQLVHFSVSVLLPHLFPLACPHLAQMLSACVPSAILPSLSALQGKLSETVITQ